MLSSGGLPKFGVPEKKGLLQKYRWVHMGQHSRLPFGPAIPAAPSNDLKYDVSIPALPPKVLWSRGLGFVGQVRFIDGLQMVL